MVGDFPDADKFDSHTYIYTIIHTYALMPPKLRLCCTYHRDLSDYLNFFNTVSFPYYRRGLEYSNFILYRILR